ncbi:MAG: hypothetical protein A2087_00905 [Spirochaetes bacterium GWD1_61_31]|nr:MAG: hypothetical protein A2Y37_03330 [Spirochaetes bacterium GWB1_60_80]OHD29640.1 MAG: hypothetical protein A2004_01870 [Spirochaetes bacterium GWC1_61_12]OHD37545.1 MAG: hypothetical protein A2087_00905 [Spirochaetes bacterium GWD1_61_31]OHD41945.1 MAG: hypothetical protein A2Y35_14360 [Spirochaetes bacterium GWE1_60_18]OHD61788.1 MAG: hypothetical protein A2Y32_13590 [Spirochaetes bacterium GWF1_60_12]
MKKRLATFRLALALTLSAWLASACAASAPEILAIDSRLIAYQVEGSPGFVERLTVFANIRDADGSDDLDALFIEHASQELFWQLTAENWNYREEGDQLWLGQNGLASGQAVLPRGEYRLTLIDLAGQRTEQDFTLAAPVKPLYEFPTLQHEAVNQLEIQSGYQLNTLFFLDAGGNVVKTVNTASGSHTLDNLWGDSMWRNQAHALTLYAFDIAAETGLFTRQIRIRK